MKYKELSESYYFQMLFLHSDPISILSPGLVELPDPSLQKQMHLQWPDDFSSFWRWKPNAPSPGLHQRHAWTFRNSRSAKPDLKCPGRIWHFMILDSCPSVQSQPFGDFRNHLFKKNIKMQIPSKFLGQNGNFSKFSGWFGEIGSHLGRCKFPCFHHFRWKNSPEPWKSEW